MTTLTKAEEQLMQVLWTLGEGFLKEIVDKSPEPRPHPNTIATLLKILVEKGYVTYETVGRNNRYRPQISKKAYGNRRVNSLLRGYFEGSPANLMSHFLNDNQLSTTELENLLEQIRKAKNDQP